MCHKSISNRANLKKHLKIRHSEQEEATCPHCRKPFRNKYSLWTHVNSYHPQAKAGHHHQPPYSVGKAIQHSQQDASSSSCGSGIPVASSTVPVTSYTTPAITSMIATLSSLTNLTYSTIDSEPRTTSSQMYVASEDHQHFPPDPHSHQYHQQHLQATTSEHQRYKPRLCVQENQPYEEQSRYQSCKSKYYVALPLSRGEPYHMEENSPTVSAATITVVSTEGMSTTTTATISRELSHHHHQPLD